MKKTLLSLALCCALLFALAGCGSGQEEDAVEDSAPTESTESVQVDESLPGKDRGVSLKFFTC